MARHGSNLLVAAFWILMFFGGYPVPMGDDICYVGAGIHLAQTGQFTNPYVPGVKVLGATDNFFIYPPCQFYMLAAWLKAFGVSHAALRAYQCLAGMIATLALFDFIARGIRGWRAAALAGALAISVAFFGSKLGLRPDLMALALFCLGLRFTHARSLAGSFVWALVLFFSGLTSGNVGVFVPLVVLYGLFFSPSRAALGSRDFFARVGMVALAGIFAGFAFLWMIDFRLAQFLDVFNRARAHATFAIPLADYMRDSWLKIRFAVEILFPCTAAVGMPLIAWLLRSKLELRVTTADLVFFLLMGLAMPLALFTSGAGPRYLYLYVLVEALAFAALSAGTRYSRLGWGLFLGWLLFVLVVGGSAFFQLITRPIAARLDNADSVRAALSGMQPSHIYLDSAAASLLYDYRLPANASDSFMGVEGVWARFPERADYAANSVMVVSTQTAYQFYFWKMMADPSKFHFTPMPFFRRLSSETAADPYELVLIPLK